MKFKALKDFGIHKNKSGKGFHLGEFEGNDREVRQTMKVARTEEYDSRLDRLEKANRSLEAELKQVKKQTQKVGKKGTMPDCGPRGRNLIIRVRHVISDDFDATNKAEWAASNNGGTINITTRLDSIAGGHKGTVVCTLPFDCYLAAVHGTCSDNVDVGGGYQFDVAVLDPTRRLYLVNTQPLPLANDATEELRASDSPFWTTTGQAFQFDFDTSTEFGLGSAKAKAYTLKVWAFNSENDAAKLLERYEDDILLDG